MRWSSCLQRFQCVWSNLAHVARVQPSLAWTHIICCQSLRAVEGMCGEKKEDRGKRRRQGWCNKRRRTGHSGILTSLKRSWPGWQERLSLCVLSLCPEPLLAVTRASLRATCTEITRQFWCRSVFVLHFAEINCQTLPDIMAWLSGGSRLSFACQTTRPLGS